MNSKEALEKSYDAEFELLDKELNEGLITLEQYNQYVKNLNQQYKDDIEELKKIFD